MIDKLKKSNPTLQIYSVTDAEFNEYGRILSIGSYATSVSPCHIDI